MSTQNLNGRRKPAALPNMKTNKPIEKDERLHSALRQWKVDTTLPPRFQEQVWKRIGREEAHAQPSFWPSILRWIESTFSRPALAFSYVAVLLMIGLTTGFVRAQDKSANAEAHWRAAYVASVDPYQAPRN